MIISLLDWLYWRVLLIVLIKVWNLDWLVVLNYFYVLNISFGGSNS